MKKMYLVLPIWAVVVFMGLVCSCGNGGKPQVDEQAIMDSLTTVIMDSINQTVNDESSSNPFSGKVYEGNGNGGGLYTEMIISFQDDNKCVCVSDWYQSYSERKKLDGKYEVKGEQVIVRCIDEDIDYEFVFDVKKDGRIIEFDHSDPEMGGTMGNDFMSLELQEAEDDQKSSQSVIEDAQSEDTYSKYFGMWTNYIISEGKRIKVYTAIINTDLTARLIIYMPDGSVKSDLYFRKCDFTNGYAYFTDNGDITIKGTPRFKLGPDGLQTANGEEMVKE